jgi:hypothetical protein
VENKVEAVDFEGRVTKSLALLNGIRKAMAVIGTLCAFAYLDSYHGFARAGFGPLQHTLWFGALFVAATIVAYGAQLIVSLLVTLPGIIKQARASSLEDVDSRVSALRAKLQKREEEFRKSHRFPWPLLGIFVLCVLVYNGLSPLPISIAALGLTALWTYADERSTRNG